MIEWVAAAAIALANPTPLQPAEMLRIADAFDQAQIEKDEPTLQWMVDDRLVFIDGSGKREGKVAFIAGWTGASDRFEPVVLTDRVVTPLGPDGFVASAETILRGASGGEPFAVRMRFSDTFRRVGGQWRAVHIHVTRMAQ